MFHRFIRSRLDCGLQCHSRGCNGLQWAASCSKSPEYLLHQSMAVLATQNMNKAIKNVPIQARHPPPVDFRLCNPRHSSQLVWRDQYSRQAPTLPPFHLHHHNLLSHLINSVDLQVEVPPLIPSGEQDGSCRLDRT